MVAVEVKPVGGPGFTEIRESWSRQRIGARGEEWRRWRTAATESGSTVNAWVRVALNRAAELEEALRRQEALAAGGVSETAA